MELYKCRSCVLNRNEDYFSTSIVIYHCHLRQHSRTGVPYIYYCQLDLCTKFFSSYKTLKRHCQRSHADLVCSYKECNEDPDIPDKSNIQETDSVAEIHDVSATGTIGSSDEWQRDAALFILQIREVHILTEKATTDVIRKTEHYMKSLYRHIIDQVRQKFPPDVFDRFKQVVDEAAGPIINQFSSVSTSYMQERFLVNNFNMILPESVVIGTSLDFKETQKDRRVIDRPHIMQYISLEKTLRILFQDASFFEMYESYKLQDNVTGILTDFKTAIVCRRHKTFSADVGAIQVLLYFDDVELCNPLGSKVRKHKISFFYVSFANLHPELRSRFSGIHLLAIALTDDLNKFGIDKVLEPFYSEIELLSEKGMKFVTANGKIKTLKCDLASVIADTPAAHQILGLKEGVGFAYRKCRKCMAINETIQTSHRECDFTLRSCAQHLSQCQYLNKTTSVAYGINRKSTIFDLKNFDPFTSVPQDAMHVILEGCIPYTLQQLLQHLLREKQLTLQFINQRIEKFPYGYLDRTNKPSPIIVTRPNGEVKLRQSASQMWLLGRILPFLLGDTVDLESEPWQCFVTLLEITSIVLSPVISENILPYLGHLIALYLQDFRSCFPEANLIPKQHYLVHIPSDIYNLGPSSRMWCMRFEAKHSFFKGLSKSKTASFKNITKHLAFKHQKNFAMLLASGQAFYHTETLGPTLKVDWSMSDELTSYLTEKRITNIVAWVKPKGCIFRPGCFVVYSVLNDMPVFAEVLAISKFSTILFVVREYCTKGVDENLNAYYIEKGQTLSLIYYRELLYFDAMMSYSLLENIFLPIKVDLSGCVDQYLKQRLLL
ncbi:uncharacterized protein LOC120326666 [Styela clava]